MWARNNKILKSAQEKRSIWAERSKWLRSGPKIQRLWAEYSENESRNPKLWAGVKKYVHFSPILLKDLGQKYKGSKISPKRGK